jgi:hypothetical protein
MYRSLPSSASTGDGFRSVAGLVVTNLVGNGAVYALTESVVATGCIGLTGLCLSGLYLVLTRVNVRPETSRGEDMYGDQDTHLTVDFAASLRDIITREAERPVVIKEPPVRVRRGVAVNRRTDGDGGEDRTRFDRRLPHLARRGGPTPVTPTAPVAIANLPDQSAQLAAALDRGEVVPAGRLLGLPELPDGDAWADIAGAAALVFVQPKTITAWLARGGPQRKPFPAPHRYLHRLYWPMSELIEWRDDA